jgi:TIR domain
MVKYEIDGWGQVVHRVYPADSPMGRIEAALRARRPEVVRQLAGEPNTRQAVYDFRHGFSAFLSHASEDKAKVVELYDQLLADGYNPWLDVRKIVAGQDWRRAIKLAQQKADLGIVCCSPRSLNKIGIVQAEIRDFLELAKMRPPDHIYIIPVRLEPCELPDELLKYQYVDLFAAGGYNRVTEALDYQALKIAEQRGKKKL